MADQPDEIVLSIALRSGLFKTELRVPFPASPETFDRAMGQWLALAQTGLQIGAERIDAVLEKQEADHG